MGNLIIGSVIILAELLVHQFESMVVRNYGKKYGKGGMFFNGIICFFAMIYIMVTNKGGFQFPSGIWVYGIISSLMYALGFYAGYVALKLGSFGDVKLLTSFGALIPIFYGIIFLKEPATFLTYVSILLIFISLYLKNNKKEMNGNAQGNSFWFVFWVIAMVLANAAISIISRMQYGVFTDEYKNEFLMISYGGATIALFILGVICERDSFKPTFRHGLLYGTLAGVFNALKNVLIIVTFNYFNFSNLSTIKTGLGIVLSFIIAIFIYKEKYTRRQLIGVGVGILAVVIRNINI